jgi:cell shape-determining protein MreC
MREEEEALRLKLEIELMRSRLRSLQEENHELRMLVDLYEGKSAPLNPPELPHFYD